MRMLEDTNEERLTHHHKLPQETSTGVVIPECYNPLSPQRLTKEPTGDTMADLGSPGTSDTAAETLDSSQSDISSDADSNNSSVYFVEYESYNLDEDGVPIPDFVTVGNIPHIGDVLSPSVASSAEESGNQKEYGMKKILCISNDEQESLLIVEQYSCSNDKGNVPHVGDLISPSLATNTEDSQSGYGITKIIGIWDDEQETMLLDDQHSCSTVEGNILHIGDVMSPLVTKTEETASQANYRITKALGILNGEQGTMLAVEQDSCSNDEGNTPHAGDVLAPPLATSTEASRSPSECGITKIQGVLNNEQKPMLVVEQHSCSNDEGGVPIQHFVVQGNQRREEDIESPYQDTNAISSNFWCYCFG